MPIAAAGRPEATYVIERLVDQAARELKLDAAELRRTNFIKPDQMPYTFPAKGVLDSGNFATNLDDRDGAAEWKGFGRARRSRQIARPRRRHRPWPTTSKNRRRFRDGHVEVRADGEVHVIAGTQSTGQGHETAYGQIVAQTPQVQIEIVTSHPPATRTRSAPAAAPAARARAPWRQRDRRRVRTSSKKASRSPPTNSKQPGRHRIRRRQIPHRRHRPAMGLFEVARIAKRKQTSRASSIAADGEFKNASNTWPNGCTSAKSRSTRNRRQRNHALHSRRRFRHHRLPEASDDAAVDWLRRGSGTCAESSTTV